MSDNILTGKQQIEEFEQRLSAILKRILNDEAKKQKGDGNDNKKQSTAN